MSETHETFWINRNSYDSQLKELQDILEARMKTEGQTEKKKTKEQINGIALCRKEIIYSRAISIGDNWQVIAHD
jgi:hypothetical protein